MRCDLETNINFTFILNPKPCFSILQGHIELRGHVRILEIKWQSTGSMKWKLGKLVEVFSPNLGCCNPVAVMVKKKSLQVHACGDVRTNYCW